MRVRILGSAAGGGVPQWNCRCPNCAAVRAGAGHVRPRTQSSVAVSADGNIWLLLNASPDIRQQVLAFPPLGPAEGKERGQSIAGCVLTDAEIDHSAGLLLLREGGPFAIACTGTVRSWLSRHFTIEPILAAFANPTWIDMRLTETLSLGGLEINAFEVDRHVPRFVAAEATAAVGSVIGLSIHDPKTRGKLVYAPCVGSLAGPLLDLARKADAVLIDGTFWSEEEPLRFGQRTATQMGHVPVRDSLPWLATLPGRHRIYVHINNTNPMLNEMGAEHELVRRKGVQVGADGDAFSI